jgi:hypothetical protein
MVHHLRICIRPVPRADLADLFKNGVPVEQFPAIGLLATSADLGSQLLKRPSRACTN